MQILKGALVLWALAYGWSIAQFWFTQPSGDGFTRGLNRVASFVGWQAVALILALGILALRGPVPKGTALRWLTLVPILLALLFVLALLSIFGWSWIQHLRFSPAG